MCLCSDIDRLKDRLASDEEVFHLEHRLERHLDAIRMLLSKSKRLSQKLSFQIKRRKAAVTVRQERTASIFQKRFDYHGQRDVFEKSKTNPQAFWCPIKDDLTPANERQISLLQDFVYSTLNSFLRLDLVETHQVLVRRLSCVVVFLLSKVLPYRYDPKLIAKSFHDVGLFRDLPKDTLQEGILQFRDAGKRYVDIAFRLGGIGAVWCLPLEVARSVWERYLPKSGVDLNKAIKHLESLGIVEQSRSYCDFVKQLIFYKIQPIFADIQSVEMYLNPLVEEIEAPSPIGIQQRALLPAAQTSREHVPSLSSCSLNSNPLTTWENIEETVGYEDCLPDTGYLLLLFHVFGGSEIPDLLFERARSPQHRWTDCGLEGQVTALEAGLDQQLVDILSDSSRLIQTIENLHPVVKPNTSTDGPRTCSLDSQLQLRLSQFLTDQEREKWCVKVLKWICFVFPRDQFWEPRFVSVGKSLLPLLNLVLQQVVWRGLPACDKIEAIEALLAASKFGNRHSQLSALTMAATILGDQPPEYLQAALAYQQSVLSRLAADFDHSESVIKHFYQRVKPNLVNRRLNSLYGRLHVSHLENLVQCDQYSTAVEEVDNWTISENPSLMECRVLPSKVVVVAKIYRSQGRFAEARSQLENCLQTLLPQDVNRYQVLCSLADVYCDLSLPDKAHAIVTPEIEIQRGKATRGKPFRRLLVAAIDIDFQRRLYRNAERTIQELEAIFSGFSDLDVSDQLLHVRVLVASARIFHYKLQFSEALGRWEAVLIHVQKYGSFEGEGFTYAVIHLSICLEHLEIGNSSEAWKAFGRAENILCRGMRDFWIPTLATVWFEFILSEIRSKTGWALSERASPTRNTPFTHSML